MSKRYVRIKSVRGQGFRTFADKFEVLFPEVGTLLVEGRNALTGGSSGAGKSNLFLAIAFALGYCPYPATVLESWYTKASMWVEIVLDTHEGEVVLRRGSKTSMTVGGIAVTGGAKGVAERLNQILGLSIPMLEALTYRGQRKPGMFLRKTDSEKKDFLTTILGLDRFEQEAEKASKKANELKGTAATKRALADNTRGMLDAAKAKLKTPEMIETLQQMTKLHTETIERAEQGIKEANAFVYQLQQQQTVAAQAAYSQALTPASVHELALSELEAQKFEFPEPSAEQRQAESMLKECERRLAALKQEDETRARELRAQRVSLEAEQRKVSSCFGLYPQVEEEIDRIKYENTKLDTGICPTCQQTWIKYQEKKVSNLKKIEECQAELVRLDGEKRRYQELMEQVQALQDFAPNPLIEKMTSAQQQLKVKVATLDQQRQASVQSQIAAKNAAVADLRYKIAEVKLTATNATTVVNKQYQEQIEEVRNRCTSLTQSLRTSQQTLMSVNQELTANKGYTETHKLLEVSYSKAQAEAELLEKQYAAELAFSKAVGREGFLGLIFDEILDEIADEATKILGSVSNTQHVSIAFRSENLTGNNTVRREIKPVLQVGDQEAVIFLSGGIPDCAGVSGGMIATIELAVDLAVGKVIAQRAGFEPGWLILDESFNGLDCPSMEACMSILQEYGRQRLVLVIDHASEFKALFDKNVTIAYDGKKSTVLEG